MDELTQLTHKKKTYKRCKQGQVSWEEYHDTVQSFSDGLRKARAHLDLNLAMDVMASKVGYYRCISSKRKTRENSYQLLNGAGD